MMPNISGIEVCRKIREKSYVPILFLTAKSLETDKMEALSAGGDDYLVKPFSYVEPGEVKNVTFTQKMNLQGGEYLLSLGVTGYNQDTFEVYHRLYDALNITVVSDKNTVGYYDMDSETKVWDAEEK